MVAMVGIISWDGAQFGLVFQTFPAVYFVGFCPPIN
jgi:hypothetical protein